ncbi:helix-turn-helix transcriptional regulator [Faecalicatena sp. AGMB00832]|uniref:Helix-turn-helix transcriptional regulator n=1 Tax=Faecalicatena faecalis TaxID=2726362 RepID=A0ABS6D2E0_9FIRM|nr:helix-turn-helix transcriptional regulator [Faecalicatena faecalis]MBU3875656.1 helix-turn-helix transcriptional regulator [Faecalicatena faecalis]
MRKVTQKQLADFLEIGVSTVSGWERGAYTPDIDTLFLICNFLQVTLNDMCGIFNDNEQLSEAESKLLNTYRSLNQSGKDKLLERAEELRDLGYVAKGDAAKMA